MAWAIWITGLPGSGKTTIAQGVAARLAAEGRGARILELDAIRRLVTPDPTYSDEERRVLYRALAVMAALLVEAGSNVIVDATHARVKWREKEVAIARQRGAQVIAVWLDVPLDVCLARNRQKPGGPWGDRVVPKETLLGVARGFEKPTVGEFDEVWKVSTDAAADGERM